MKKNTIPRRILYAILITFSVGLLLLSPFEFIYYNIMWIITGKDYISNNAPLAFKIICKLKEDE
jgi:hypothetical protein